MEITVQDRKVCMTDSSKSKITFSSPFVEWLFFQVLEVAESSNYNVGQVMALEKELGITQEWKDRVENNSLDEYMDKFNELRGPSWFS